MKHQKTLILKSKHLAVASIITSAQWHGENEFKKTARALCKSHGVFGKSQTSVTCDDYIYDAETDCVRYRYD